MTGAGAAASSHTAQPTTASASAREAPVAVSNGSTQHTGGAVPTSGAHRSTFVGTGVDLATRTETAPVKEEEGLPSEEMEPELLKSLMRRHAQRLKAEAEERAVIAAAAEKVTAVAVRVAEVGGPCPAATPPPVGQPRAPMPLAKFARAPPPPLASASAPPVSTSSVTSSPSPPAPAVQLLGGDGAPLTASSPASAASGRKTVMVDLRAGATQSSSVKSVQASPVHTQVVSSAAAASNGISLTTTWVGESAEPSDSPPPPTPSAATSGSLSVAAAALKGHPAAAGKLGVQIDEDGTRLVAKGIKIRVWGGDDSPEPSQQHSPPHQCDAATGTSGDDAATGTCSTSTASGDDAGLSPPATQGPSSTSVPPAPSASPSSSAKTTTKASTSTSTVAPSSRPSLPKPSLEVPPPPQGAMHAQPPHSPAPMDLPRLPAWVEPSGCLTLTLSSPQGLPSSEVAALCRWGLHP